MPFKTVEGTSKFHIFSSFTLSSDDVHALSLLYAPLIGNDAFALYMAFASLLERNNLKSEEIIHQDLFDMYSLTPSEFASVRAKLEGIGLLITYEREGDYIYVLQSPLTPKNFIKDATYGLYLYGKISRETFDFIKRHFEIEKPLYDGYQNITVSFDDVFTSRVDNDATMEKFGYILGRNASNNLQIKNVTFDFDKFIKMINKDFLEAGVSSTFKDQIIKLAYVYKFSESEMAKLYADSINRMQLFDYRLLKKKANMLFNYMRNMNAPILEDKTENNGTDKDDLISWLDNTSPSDILSQYMKNYPASFLDTINDIYVAIELPKGVLNCMILKALRDKGGDLPGVAYFKKMSESWIKDSVFSTEDAIKYITTVKEKTSSSLKKRDKDFSSQAKKDIEWEELQ